MELVSYPAAPDIPVNIEVSTNFRHHVSKVIACIILFCIVYLALIVAVGTLAFASCYYALVLIISYPRWTSLLLGVGMIATGVSLVFFLIKFIGSVSKNHNAGRIEIKENDQSELFDFLRNIAAETQTSFPKKVFISPDVNASVFYNSSFLSMFFPVKKNLEIGLGLVNCINLSEFKAIVAHEFGHFSQRSMKVGSFTYHVNIVIHNMLYENTSYTSFINQWGGLHGLLSLFAGITVKISQFIQWILRGLYSIINKEYMALSREMEFHADCISASVSGGNNLISALTRSNLGQSCYQKAIQDANEFAVEQKRVKNIFHNQAVVCGLIGKQFDFQVKNGIPDVTYQFSRSLESSRINFKNQWASHPTLAERKANLDVLNIEIAPVVTSPWELFRDREKMQEILTKELYAGVEFEGEPHLLDNEAYEHWLNSRKNYKSLPSIYKGFYSGRYLSLSEKDVQHPENIDLGQSFDELFSAENGNIQSLIDSAQSDLQTVHAIQAGQVQVKSFDFDGKKYAVADCQLVIDQLEIDINSLSQKQYALDKQAYAYFYIHAENNETIRDSYITFIEKKELEKDFLKLAHEVADVVERISQTVTLDQANAEGARLKEIDAGMKPMLDVLIKKNTITKESNEALLNNMSSFKSKSYVYFFGTSFLDNEVLDLFTLTSGIVNELTKHTFEEYKSLLQRQLQATNIIP